MPKTKVSSKKKVLSECQAEPPVPPRLDDLKKLAAGEEDLLMDELEEQENFELEVETPKENQKAAKGGRTFIRTPRNANGGGAGITTLDTKLTKKNLGNLFKMEETMIETIRLEDTGRSHHHHHHQGLASSASHIAKAEAMDCFIRVRPLLPQEVARGENKGCFKVLPEAKGIALIPPVASHLYRRLANSQDGKVGYDFTHVLGDELQQRDVFIRTMHKPIQQFLGGTSQLIFTYGVTNSGKTYTLLGPRGNPGILPRALDRIFAALGGNVSESCKHQPVKYEDIILLDSQAQREAKDRRENYLAQKAPKAPKEPAPVVVSSSSASSQDFHSQASQSTDSHGFFDYRPVSEMDHEVIHDRDCLDEQAKYEVWVSFVEIYEDVAYDLLDMNNAVKTGRALRSGTLKITDEGDTCYARGLIEVPVFSAADAYHVMGLGRKNLHVAMTKLNDASSRSHSIFTVKLVKLALNGKEAFVTQLTFCDLAGTERANRTDNTGIRMKESQNINKDLHHLKECIEALRKSRSTKPGRKKEMVPYRNCKLTRLFRSFFSGRGRASMIVNISQCASDFDETVQAIRFGASAMRIMITMSKRESILLRQPGDYRKIAGKNVISVEVEESLADIDENDEEGSGAGMSDDEEFDDDDNAAGVSREHITETAQKVRGGGGSRTITKKPNPPTGSKTKTKQNRARRQDSNIKSHLKPRAQSADKPVRRGRQPMSIGGGRPLDDESTSEEASSTDATNTDSDTGRSSTAGEEEEDYGQEEDEDVNEADLTLGSAVRGARKIPEDFWEENCPFPEHRHEKDPRVRGLLLLLGSCQTQIKQSKALNMTNEMKVRKDLCDYYDKEREKQAREFQKLLKKREAEFEEDLQRQLKYQRDHDERMYQSRIDPSLVSFEQHEKDEEVDELRRENAHLRQQLEEARNRTLD